jgi:hypothetical protein
MIYDRKKAKEPVESEQATSGRSSCATDIFFRYVVLFFIAFGFYLIKKSKIR